MDHHQIMRVFGAAMALYIIFIMAGLVIFAVRLELQDQRERKKKKHKARIKTS